MSPLAKGGAFSALAISLILSSVAAAQTPLGNTFTYQGQLKNSGSPAGGSFNMVFQLFDALTLGNQIGPTLTFDGVGGNPPPVAVTGGLFTVPIDFGSTAFGGSKRWLSISVNGTTLTPRQELTAAPNAVFASNADRLDGLDSTAFLQSIPVPLTLSGTSATHIIRGENASASGGSGVFGLASNAGGFVTYGVMGQTNGTASSAGVYGYAPAGNTYGVSGVSDGTTGSGVLAYSSAPSGAAFGLQSTVQSTSGVAVYGLANALSGANYAGKFTNRSPDGTGVYGEDTATSGVTFGGSFRSASTSGTGVFGSATAATGITYGGQFLNASSLGIGVFGSATAASTSNFGVYGLSASTAGAGVFGKDNSATGEASGVYGQSLSTSGYGVFGLNTASDGFTAGGRFQCSSTYGFGVWAESTAVSGIGYGVWGHSFSPNGRGVVGTAHVNGGTCYGVYGDGGGTAGSYGVYASGASGASGTKSFRIDHPDDPESKYLLHYCAESPDVINFYSGKVALDAAGQAEVALPEYFGKINKDPRYQLTPIGAPMPLLHIAKEIDEDLLTQGAKAQPGDPAPHCSFRIAGGAPNSKVSWEVKALRNDRWVQQHGAPVELNKQGPEKGTYQHPDLYGQPPEMGMNYRAEHERPSSAAVPDARRP